MISIHSCWICLKGNETPPCPVHFQKCYFINMGFHFLTGDLNCGVLVIQNDGYVEGYVYFSPSPDESC